MQSKVHLPNTLAERLGRGDQVGRSDNNLDLFIV